MPVRRTRGTAAGLLGLLALLVAMVGWAGSPAQAAAQPAGTVGIRLLGAPATGQDDPRARIYLLDRLSPGASVSRDVEITNTSDAAVSVSVYAGAANLKADVFSWVTGRTGNELTSWTTITNPTLLIPAGGKALDTVRLQVPSTVASGEHYGVIWAQVDGGSAAGGGVDLVNRVGVRMYVTVGHGNTPPAAFTITTLTGSRNPGASPVVTATVHNTGGSDLDLSGTLTLTDGPGGTTAGPFPVTSSTTISPGQTRPITVALDRRIPDGPWTAHLTLHTADIQQHITQRLQFTASAAAVLVTHPHSKSSLSTAVILEAVALAVAMTMVVAFELLRRRTRHRKLAGS